MEECEKGDSSKSRKSQIIYSFLNGCIMLSCIMRAATIYEAFTNDADPCVERA